jgi:hypothetical protein
LDSLSDASVIATHGEVGHVCDFLFDDLTWKIGYLDVELRIG